MTTENINHASDSQTIVPWSVIRDWNIPQKTVEKLERLEKYDLSQITENFINKGRQFSPEQVWPIQEHFGKADLEIAQLLEREFKRFVALTLLRPKNVYAPAGPVDMYWHFFVLHTREYEKFCKDIWGMSPESETPLLDQQDDSEASIATFSSKLLPQSVTRSLSHEKLRALKQLEEFDLSLITNELIDKNRRFSPEQVWPIKAHFGKADLEVARLLESEFRKFVALTLIQPNITFAPSGPVDMYWHFLILHTREYRKFCNNIWGAFQHHPRGSLSEKAKVERGSTPVLMEHHPQSTNEKMVFSQVVEMYEKVYGSADPKIWHDPDKAITQ